MEIKVLLLVMTMSCRLISGGSCVLVWDDEMHGEQSLTECFQIFFNCLEIFLLPNIFTSKPTYERGRRKGGHKKLMKITLEFILHLVWLGYYFRVIFASKNISAVLHVLTAATKHDNIRNNYYGDGGKRTYSAAL